MFQKGLTERKWWKLTDPFYSNQSDDTEKTWLTGFFNIKDPGIKLETAGFLIFILLWIGLSALFFSREGYEHFRGFLPLPAFKALCGALSEPRFWVSVLASLQRIVAGILIASAIGIPVGILVGFFPVVRKLTYSPIQFIRMISPLSWMPVALLVFSDFESAVWFLIVMATVCPIILNMANGVMSINPRWIKMAMNQGASNIQLIRTIVIPFSFSYILTSLRLALGIAWIVLVPAEFLGVSSGLGYLINDARDTMEYDRLMAMIIAIGAIGFILDGTLRKMQGFFHWTWTE